METDSRTLRQLQRHFLVGACALLPFSPFLYVQGQITRWKIGVLPGAGGKTHGSTDNGTGGDAARLLVLGESTVAGLGARDHEHALAGRFAHYLSKAIERSVEWDVVGKNGVTAQRTIEDLLPLVPDKKFDFVLLGIGGNDVLKLSSPRKWRRDMLELLSLLRKRNDASEIFITNCPMIIESPALPEPIKSILWRLSQMHDRNIREFSRDLGGITYYPQPERIDSENFFADGIHPSEEGYDRWARAMIEYFAADHKLWR
ncbi:MAG: SGNH/GDSL hydrolase family protein [Acidobacteria bacterium ACB1]|nr:SGNH/GDSL hydrolase family protein [Acidobacteria bacterium ACB1]